MGTAKMGPLIFSMALPAMISMIINALYNIVDSIFVAKYSQDALAAVSLVYPLQMLVVAIGVGTGVGVNSLIARRLGERRQEAADLAAEHGVALSVIGGIAFFIIGWGLSGTFVGAFGASEAVSTNAVQYSHIAVGMRSAHLRDAREDPAVGRQHDHPDARVWSAIITSSLTR